MLREETPVPAKDGFEACVGGLYHSIAAYGGRAAVVRGCGYVAKFSRAGMRAGREPETRCVASSGGNRACLSQLWGRGSLQGGCCLSGLSARRGLGDLRTVGLCAARYLSARMRRR